MPTSGNNQEARGGQIMSIKNYDKMCELEALLKANNIEWLTDESKKDEWTIEFSLCTKDWEMGIVVNSNDSTVNYEDLFETIERVTSSRRSKRVTLYGDHQEWADYITYNSHYEIFIKEFEYNMKCNHVSNIKIEVEGITTTYTVTLIDSENGPLDMTLTITLEELFENETKQEQDDKEKMIRKTDEKARI